MTLHYKKNKYYITMVKKVLLVLFLLIFCNIAFAEDEKNSNNEWGENSSVFNSGFENQKAVSDKKMHQVIDQLKERALSRKQRKIKNEVKPLSPMSDSEHLKEFAQSQSVDDALTQTHTVMIPMQAYSEDGIYIQPGYYKLSCRKIGENTYVLDLSQGTKVVMTVSAEQTQQDLEQETITFCNAEIIGKGRIRLMFGSIDLNLVGYIYY